VRFLSLDVVLEFEEAIETYEEQRPGRGDRFAAEVRATFRRIEAGPLAFPRSPIVLRPVVRRAKVMRFPYSVFYYLLAGEPIVLAIAHRRRHPAHWRKRLR
jgi:plasmid stabilization system protein ParE